MSDEVQTATPETQPGAPAEAPQPAAPAPAAPGDAPSPVPAAAPVQPAPADPPPAAQSPVAPAAPAAAPAAELNPGVDAPAAELNPGVGAAPTVHETMLQRAHDELDRIIHRIAVGLDKGIDDLRALKASIASHLGL